MTNPPVAEVRIVPHAEVVALLPMDECIERVAESLASLSRGDAVLPLRSAVRIPAGTGLRRLLGLMPAWLGSPHVLGLKAVTVPSHQGAVLLFDPEHGSLAAMVDASAITAIRTAAASGVATRLLAREGAGDLAILGSGVQAGTHLDAMRTVRMLRRVRVWSRSFEHARIFAERARPGAVAVEAVRTAREAVEGADLICTTTASPEPVLRGSWLAPGAHVNAVGACFAGQREVDSQAIARARVYVDRRESALSEAGDILIPMAEGAVGRDTIVGEIGEVLLGRVEARRSSEEITLFKSLGLAVEDLAAAEHVYRKALATGAGVSVPWGAGHART